MITASEAISRIMELRGVVKKGLTNYSFRGLRISEYHLEERIMNQDFATHFCSYCGSEKGYYLGECDNCGAIYGYKKK